MDFERILYPDYPVERGGKPVKVRRELLTAHDRVCLIRQFQEHADALREETEKLVEDGELELEF